MEARCVCVSVRVVVVSAGASTAVCECCSFECAHEFRVVSHSDSLSAVQRSAISGSAQRIAGRRFRSLHVWNGTSGLSENNEEEQQSIHSRQRKQKELN